MFNPLKGLGAAVAGLAVSACVTLPAPGLAPRPAVSIAASVDQTWDSALDQLAERNIAIRSVERNSGFIATETIALPPFSIHPDAWADCGSFASFRFAPTVVDYTIFVRGDSTTSSMKTSARYRFVQLTGEVPTDCVSNGALEKSFDASVKQRAEITRQDDTSQQRSQ
jgi:hypothetical protein